VAGHAAKLAINQGRVIHETIDGEVIVIHLESGNYYSLRGSGSWIWQLLQDRTTVDQLVDRLVEGGTTPPEAVETAVRRFVEELLSEDLLTEADRDGAGPTELAPAHAGGTNGEFVEPKLEKYTDMRDLVRLDPVHEVGSEGWPNRADQEHTNSPAAVPDDVGVGPERR